MARAHKKSLVEFAFYNLRDFTSDRHRTVDDYPYGGGCGMVMMPGPIKLALERAASDSPPQPWKRLSIYLTPQGRLLRQQDVEELSKYDELTLFCGHYEDIDYRARGLFDAEYSIGDYVLSGGEPAALALIDAVTRKMPGALGNPDSSQEDSFSKSRTLFDCPHYTRPPVWEGRHVPEVLLNGDHKKIEAYRKARAIINTMRVRPDLLKPGDLGPEELKVIREYFRNYQCYDE